MACLNTMWSTPVVVDHEGKAVEVLDAPLEHLPVHQANLHRQPFAPAPS